MNARIHPHMHKTLCTYVGTYVHTYIYPATRDTYVRMYIGKGAYSVWSIYIHTYVHTVRMFVLYARTYIYPLVGMLCYLSIVQYLAILT